MPEVPIVPHLLEPLYMIYGMVSACPALALMCVIPLGNHTSATVCKHYVIQHSVLYRCTLDSVASGP
jgi:hypothetical protein